MVVRIVIGIDPGKQGALCILPVGAHDPILHVMPPSIQETADILERYPTAHVYIEKAQAMPGQGVSSMFNYGLGFGELLGVVAAFKMTSTLVHPRTWCKEMHSGTKGGAPKARSLEAAHRLFPWVNFKASDRCKKSHMGLVDATLIAEHGRRRLAWATSHHLTIPA